MNDLVGQLKDLYPIGGRGRNVDALALASPPNLGMRLYLVLKIDNSHTQGVNRHPGALSLGSSFIIFNLQILGVMEAMTGHNDLQNILQICTCNFILPLRKTGSDSVANLLTHEFVTMELQLNIHM